MGGKMLGLEVNRLKLNFYLNSQQNSWFAHALGSSIATRTKFIRFSFVCYAKDGPGLASMKHTKKVKRREEGIGRKVVSY
jgi:hypothetical protein